MMQTKGEEERKYATTVYQRVLLDSHGLLESILSYSNVHDLVRASEVSRYWHSASRQDILWKVHYGQSTGLGSQEQNQNQQDSHEEGFFDFSNNAEEDKKLSCSDSSETKTTLDASVGEGGADNNDNDDDFDVYWRSRLTRSAMERLSVEQLHRWWNHPILKIRRAPRANANHRHGATTTTAAAGGGGANTGNAGANMFEPNLMAPSEYEKYKADMEAEERYSAISTKADLIDALWSFQEDPPADPDWQVRQYQFTSSRSRRGDRQQRRRRGSRTNVPFTYCRYNDLYYGIYASRQADIRGRPYTLERGELTHPYGWNCYFKIREEEFWQDADEIRRQQQQYRNNNNNDQHPAAGRAANHPGGQDVEAPATDEATQQDFIPWRERDDIMDYSVDDDDDEEDDDDDNEENINNDVFGAPTHQEWNDIKLYHASICYFENLERGVAMEMKEGMLRSMDDDNDDEDDEEGESYHQTHLKWTWNGVYVRVGHYPPLRCERLPDGTWMMENVHVILFLRQTRYDRRQQRRLSRLTRSNGAHPTSASTRRLATVLLDPDTRRERTLLHQMREEMVARSTAEATKSNNNRNSRSPYPYGYANAASASTTDVDSAAAVAILNDAYDPFSLDDHGDEEDDLGGNSDGESYTDDSDQVRRPWGHFV